MSTFEEIVKKNLLKQENVLNFQKLVKLVEEVHSIRTPIAEAEKESQTATQEELCLLVPDFRIDPSWMSIESRGVYQRDKEKLIMAFEATGLPRNIEQLSSFVTQINTILTEPVDVSDHTAAISRIQVLRIFYNLSNAKDETIAGFLFEVLMALAFDGHRIPPKEDKEHGVVDVLYPESAISLKFIQSTRTDIKGALSKLAASFERHESIKYIIADKRGKEIVFKELVLNNDETSHNYWKNVPGLQIQDDGSIKGNMRGSMVAFERNGFIFTELPTLSLQGVNSKTGEILEALNLKFENLLGTLRDLNAQVTELLYVTKDPVQTKTQAGHALDTALDTALSAEKIHTGN